MARSGSSGRPGTPAPSCCGSAPATPSSTSRWPPVTARPDRGRRPVSRAWPRPTATCASSRTTPPTSTASTWCSWPSPRRLAGARARAAKRVPHVVDLAADFRLQRSRLVPAVVRRGAHASRAARPSSPTACPSCSATTSRGAAPSPRRAATRPPPRWPSPRWCAPGSSSPPGIIVDAASGVSGAGRRPQAEHRFCTVDEDFTAYGLLDHRHTPEMEQAGRAAATGPVHAPPGADEPGDPRHVLRPAAGATSTTAELLALCTTPTTTSPSSSSATIARPPRPRSGSNSAHVTARSDDRTGWVVVALAPSTTWSRGRGQAVQCAEPRARPARGAGLLVGNPCISVCRAPRSWPRPSPVASRPVGLLPTCPGGHGRSAPWLQWCSGP